MGFSLLRLYRCLGSWKLLKDALLLSKLARLPLPLLSAWSSAPHDLEVFLGQQGMPRWTHQKPAMYMFRCSGNMSKWIDRPLCYNTAWLCWFIREAFPKNNARIANTVQPKLPPALLTIWATFVTFKKVSKSIWVGHPPFPHNNLGNFFTFENVTKSIWRRTKRKSVFFFGMATHTLIAIF